MAQTSKALPGGDSVALLTPHERGLGRHIVPGTVQVAEGPTVKTDTVLGLMKPWAGEGDTGDGVMARTVYDPKLGCTLAQMEQLSESR